MQRIWLFLSGLFVFLLAVQAMEPFVVEQTVVRSPLDKNSLTDSEKVLKNRTENVKGANKAKHTEVLYVKGVHVPDCARGCTAQLFATFDVAIRSGNNFERFSNVCDRFNETVVCLANLNHCSSFELFNALSSGMRYMCIEQREAFAAVIDCIDTNSAEIKDSCVKSCNAQGIFTGWAVYAALRDAQLITPQIGNVPSKVNVAFFRKMTGEGCAVLHCYLGCLREKYNNRCYGVAGSLLSEVLVRPIAVGSESVVLSPLSNFAKLMLPDECGFLTSSSALSSLRIDRKLNEDLKRTYTSNRKAKEFKYILPNSTVVTNEKPNPFTKDLSGQHVSPLEDNTFDRDQLWRSALSPKNNRQSHYLKEFENTPRKQRSQ